MLLDHAIAAIEAYRSAFKAFPDTDDEAAIDGAGANLWAMQEAICRRPPTTAAGCAALARYCLEFEEELGPELTADALRSLATALDRIAAA